MPWFLPALLLHLLGQCPVGSAGCSSVQFNSQQLCPSEADTQHLPALTHVDSDSPCLARCALVPTCSAVYFSAAVRTCWMATQWQQDAWRTVSSQQPTCVSQAKTPGPPQGSASGQLALWYNFRHSLLNLVNSSAYPAQLVNADRNASGAILHGSSDGSYVSLSVPQGLQWLVGAGNHFSYYMKAERDLKSATYYVRASDSGGTAGRMYLWESGLTFLVANAVVSSNGFSTEPVAANSRAVVSLGAVYNGSFYIYYNGAMHGAALNPSYSLSNGDGSDLRLGYKHNDYSKSLSGRVMCFGAWTRDLSLGEFQSLEPQC